MASRTCKQSYDSTTPASAAIIKAIAVLEDVDVTHTRTELGLVLYDHVDPEALNILAGDGTGDGSLCIEFEIDQYQVEIENDGHVFVTAP